VPKRRIFVLILSIPLLLLLLFGGIAAYYSFANPTTAQVNIQPEVRQVQNAASLTVVAGQPDAAQRQVAGASLLSATTTQTVMQTATGTGNTQAASASGTIEMVDHIPYGYVSESVGTVLTGSDGITIVSDLAVTDYLDQGGIAYFRAHVASPGSRGNIPAHAFQAVTYDGLYSASFSNVTPFTGGQDAGPYTFVQQTDITAGEQALTSTVKQRTLAALNAKVPPNDQWVSTPTCTPKATADETAGQRVQSFHVTVTESCSGEVYNIQTVKAAAAQALTTIAQSELGQGYQQLGEIATTITGVQVVNTQGTLAISQLSRGTWAYHFTDAQKHHLAQLISGKSIGDAQKLLSQQADVEHVTITTAHGFWLWNTVPADTNKINITIQ